MIPLLVAGVGISTALPIAPAVIVSAVKPRDMGRAAGTNRMLQRFGAAFGIAVGPAVFAANGHIGTPAEFVAGFQPALIVVASLSLAGAVTALGVGSTPRVAVARPAVDMEAVSAA